MNKNGMEIVNGVLVKYTGDDTKVVVPDIVTSIGNNAFADCFFGRSYLARYVGKYRQ